MLTWIKIKTNEINKNAYDQHFLNFAGTKAKNYMGVIIQLDIF